MPARTTLGWCSLLLAAPLALAAQETQYRVPPIYLPELDRPALRLTRAALPQGATGTVPAYDGAPFQVNHPSAAAGAASPAAARALALGTLRAFGWTRDSSELVAARSVAVPGTNRGVLDTLTQQSVTDTERRVSGRVGPLGDSARRAVQQTTQEFADQASRAQQLFTFDQRVRGVRIEHSGIQVRWIDGGRSTVVSGRAFNGVQTDNANRLSRAAALEAARRHVARYTTLEDAQADTGQELVLLPYGRAMRYAWRVTVAAVEGSYRLWVDAADGRPLELEPLFAPETAGGPAFNPNPNGGTVAKSFEIDSAVGGNFILRLAGVLDVNNAGADGVSTGDVTNTTTDFDVAPLNGTVVDRVGTAGYNSRFQELNAYAWVYGNIQLAEALGSQPYPSLTVTVNHNNPCGFGINNACGGSTALTFGIGSATTGTSTSPSAFFNSAIDATVVTHEWAHSLNRLQYGVSGGSLTGSIDEGLADFWAGTIHNTDTFGAWWAQNNPTPVQTGGVPRQAEAQDVFPEHRALATGSHADGQIINWALWRSRTGLNGLSILGTLVINHHLIQAEAAAGVGVLTGTTDRRVHDGYLDLFQQLAPQFGSSRHTNKLLAGFARAGLTLSERDAIIDIDDDYLARGGVAPVFTVFTGRDYQFNAAGTATATNVFNTQFTIEVANDAAFSVNLVSSGTLTGVAVTGGVPLATWTLPAADWTTIGAGDFLYYRVTTTDATGGNSRISTSPGDGFMVVDAPRAVINASGRCECSASATGIAGRNHPWVLALPLAIILVWRRRLRRIVAR